MATLDKGLPPEQFFAALADRTRLRLLNLIHNREICVCYFVQVLHTSQPKISRHLAYLRRARLVRARRQGKWMHYRLRLPANPLLASILLATLEGLSFDPEMRRDAARMHRASCAPHKFVTLQDAPPPLQLPPGAVVSKAARRAPERI